MVSLKKSDWVHLDVLLLGAQCVSCDRHCGSPRTGLKKVKVERGV
jgi:hypothetical protein